MLMMVSLILVEVCRGSDGKQSSSISKSVSHHILKHTIRILQMTGRGACLDLGEVTVVLTLLTWPGFPCTDFQLIQMLWKNPKALVGTRRQVYPSCPLMPRDLVQRDYLSFKYKTSVIP